MWEEEEEERLMDIVTATMAVAGMIAIPLFVIATVVNYLR